MNQQKRSLNNLIEKGKYRHTRLLLDNFHPTSHWIIIEEDLVQTRDVGGVELEIPDKKYNTLGHVLSVGPQAIEAGIKVGDKVVYEQWQGGRWAFTTPIPDGTYVEKECLIMSTDSVWAIIR